ncbi:NAD(P)H-hydrate dehydratase [Granulicella cerasi]|uniref:Bifunctional NAD(P)H-hydrate repair enzyme n=1 Tax=Granulicella cerasi TaxID=741063 RepID=A0ABW1ZBT0_9BACT|nr:NAD(P)H-hydrate dehydratase [Granulicella cerasi]
MKILTAAEMGEADKRSVDAGVSVHDLMEQAGAAVAAFVREQFPDRRVIVILAGKGNNGGDGMVAARELAEGYGDVRIALLGRESELKGDALAAWEAAGEAAKIECESIDDLFAALEGAELVIDAIVGTGFKPPLRGLAASAKDILDGILLPVVAVDLPSGWDADSTEQTVDGACRANAVVSFAAPKLAHVFGHLTAPDVFGPVLVAPIGTPEEAIVSTQNLTWAGASKEITETPRNINSNKGRFGHVLIVGGALGKAGAPSMASLAALRSGAGLVTAAVEREILPTVASVASELMLTPLDLAATSFDSLTKGISIVGLGPGLGTTDAAKSFVERFIPAVDLPMVIDADALNILSEGRLGLLKQGKPRTFVLTPHPGEMARLLGVTVKEVEADRINLARKFATEHGVTLVLKGWRTLIAHPDGRIAVNTTGNPSMSKGGSGDILTGIVAALVGQFPDNVAEAVETAVYLHGLAGDFACAAQDEHTVLATDTIMHLFEAFRSRAVDGNEMTWLTGLAVR